MIETVAGRFELIAPAGRGGSAVVHRGRDRATGRAVAVKLVDPDALGRARFDREAAALAALDAPGIVRYIAHGEHGDRLYLVEEWLDGEPLRARLAERGATVAEAVTAVLAAARGLAPAHACGIVHRDIKPEHLWLVGGALDRVTIIDFGIARAARDPRVTTTGRVIGTPAYMAPEQARGDRGVDARADVFALGAVLYEALAGAPPFGGRTDGAIRAKVVLAEPPALSALCPEAPSALIALVGAMLAKDPAARPADASAVASALAGIATDRDGVRRRAATEVAATVITGAVTAEHDAATGFVIAAGPVTADGERLAGLAGARVEVVDGGLWLTVLGAGAARARAVADGWHAALGAPVAVAALVAGLDDAIERAADALERAALLAEFASYTDAGPAPVLLDSTTAALLDRAALTA
jgi:predicted Ser/Thr protein kinase